jgi:WD40 repeat protein
MSNRSSSGGEESSSALDRKRQAKSTPASLDNEDPLQPASSSEEHDASPVPSMLPINLIAALILPYVQDRSTWNSVCRANKELNKAGKRMMPPWPNTTLNFGAGTVVVAVAFSPCTSVLACSISTENVVHFWDWHGEKGRLEGHTNEVTRLQYSLDGKYLASGSSDKSIRIWRMKSESALHSSSRDECVISESAAHSSSRDESRNRGTSKGTPQSHSDIILLGHLEQITALAFSRTDSNLLASGCQAGEIKLWDVNNQVCIHAFEPLPRSIQTIFFSPGDNIQCNVVTMCGRMIRIVRNKRMEFAATIPEEPWLGKYPLTAFSPCGTSVACISYMESGRDSELAMFDLRTMAKTQSVLLSGGRVDFASMAISPDGKNLATVTRSRGTQIFECHDLTIQKFDIDQRPGVDVGFSRLPVAFDPTSRFFAVGCIDGRVELRTL